MPLLCKGIEYPYEVIENSNTLSTIDLLIGILAPIINMTLQELQSEVDIWIKTVGIRYYSELTNTAILSEECGEVARLMARMYGDQSFKSKEEEQNAKNLLASEISDVLFVLTCIANQTGIDLEKSLVQNMEFKKQRDLARHQNNPKLK